MAEAREGQEAALPDLGKVGPFLQAVGLELDEVDGRRMTGHAELSADHHTPWGMVHGGVYTTIIESVASTGASGAVRERGQFAVGVNNPPDFLRSMAAGRVEVVGEPLSQ